MGIRIDDFERDGERLQDVAVRAPLVGVRSDVRKVTYFSAMRYSEGDMAAVSASQHTGGKKLVPAGTALVPSSRYSAAMSKIVDEAMDAVRALSGTAQADIAHETRDRALKAQGFTWATSGYELRAPSAWILGRPSRYLATDAHVEAIARARKNRLLQLTHMNAGQMPYSARIFSRVLMR